MWAKDEVIIYKYKYIDAWCLTSSVQRAAAPTLVADDFVLLGAADAALLVAAANTLLGLCFAVFAIVPGGKRMCCLYDVCRWFLWAAPLAFQGECSHIIVTAMAIVHVYGVGILGMSGRLVGKFPILWAFPFPLHLFVADEMLENDQLTTLHVTSSTWRKVNNC